MLAWFRKRTQPPLIPAAATQPGLPTESGAWRTVARAGSRSHSGQLAARLGMSQVPRPHPHPHSKPRISWWWGRGLVSARGLTGYRGAVLPAHNSCCLPRARMQPPSSPADEDNLVPELTICMPAGGRWLPGAQFTTSCQRSFKKNTPKVTDHYIT